MRIAPPEPMQSHAALMPATIRDRLLADHRRLETLLERLLAAFEANDREDMAQGWTEFESGLLAHLEAEETYLFPALQRASARDASVLIREHRHIRTRLTEIGVALDLHTVRLASARDFVDELRAHSRNEDRLLYRWAGDHLDETQRTSLFEALSTVVRARPSKVVT